MQPFQFAWMILKDSARYRPDSGDNRMRIAPGVDPRALSWGDVYGHATAPPASQCPCGRDPCICENYPSKKILPDVNKPTVAPRDAPGGPDTLTHNLYRRPIVGGE